MPNLYIIAGCNGAGKTTASYTILPEILNCKEFINADEIARGISPFQPEKAAIAAGRIMLQRIEDMFAQKRDFAIETTLTTKSYAETIKNARQKGYKISLLFLWLPNINLAIIRVKLRVLAGGHNIPVAVVKRRYKRGIVNLFTHFLGWCHYWAIVDKSGKTFKFVADGEEKNNTSILKIHDNEKWKIIQKQFKRFSE
jgi:predicted ABC-type ATPase